MNHALETLAREISLATAENASLRLAFGHACALRVRHLLEDPAVDECLVSFGRCLAGTADPARLAALAATSARLANKHQGSRSIDGCGHAAVSASYAVAKAIDGKGLEAASYAAYAAVYAQGGYAAVAERESFEPEWAWQLDCLASLARTAESAAPAASA